MFKALSPAIPDRVIAGHHADLVLSHLHGINPKTREFFIANFGPLGGGWGAKRSEDGVGGTVSINDGDTHNAPNEQSEAKFPLVVERYALVPDSGGAGRHRGGLGVERVVRARTNMMFNTQFERAHCRPWGLEGGLEGTGNSVGLRRDGDMEDRFPERQGAVDAAADRRCLSASAPAAAAATAIRMNARRSRSRRTCGRVTCRSRPRREHYGVVVDPETFAVDKAATKRRGNRCNVKLAVVPAEAEASARGSP